MHEALWKLEQVSLGNGAQPRLRDVSLRVQPGATAVLGCSGAGKTSLLNLLVGFEKPDAGRLSAYLPTGSQLPLYWAPQNGGLWPHLTVREHLEAVGGEEIDGLLADLDIRHRAGAHPGDLSMGERARLSLARALAARPAVLVLDEPLAHVDVAGAGRYWRAVRDRVARSGASLVFATHLPRMVLGEAERVVCLREGRVIYEGEVQELYLRPPSREAAECLGEVNWLEPADEPVWLAEGADGRRCYRPEHLAIAPVPDGPLIVREHTDRGTLAETELLHEPTGQTRRFFHRPTDGPIPPGRRARLTVALVTLACALAGMLSAGCGGENGPRLKVRERHSRLLPRDGIKLPAPRSVAVGPEGQVVVLDDAGRCLVYGRDGSLQRSWHMPEITVGRPEGVVVLRDGRIVVCDTHYHRVLTFDGEGNVLSRFGAKGRAEGQFIFPVGVTVDADENLYVCEYGSNDRVQKFRPDGTFVLAFGSFGAGVGQFQRPSGMVWRDGRVYVADAINNRIQVFTDTGAFLGVLGGAKGAPSLHFPYDMALGQDGALYAVEYGAGRVTKLGLDGRVLGRWGRTGIGEDALRTPWGLAVDANMKLIIADTGNRRIVELGL